MSELAAVYLSVIPETSKVASGVRRGFKNAEPEAQRAGKAHGQAYSRGFVGSALAGLVGMKAAFATITATSRGLLRNVGTIAAGTKLAAFAAGQLAKSISRAGGVLAALGGGAALGKLAVGLKLVSRIAGTVARDIGRITSALLVMQTVAKGIGVLNRFGKIAAVGTIGFSALLGAVAGVVQLVGGPLLSAITAVGAAMGVAAGAAAGILGPALVALKVGFKGLSDGAKEFNKQFADADEALNKRLGNMMAPLLTAWHDASSEMKLAFATALQPAFASVGGLVGQLRPQLAGLSTTLGGVGTEIAKSLTGPVAKQGFADMIAASNTFFSAFKGESGLGGLASGLVSFAGTASKTFAGVGTSINEAFLGAGEWLRNISPEQMTAAMDQVKQVFQNVSAVVGPVISGLRQLAGISAPALAPGFQAIGQAITEATPGIIQMARELMPALGQVMSNLAPVLPSIVDAFTPWASVVAVIAPHIATLVSNLGPLAPLVLGLALAAKGISGAMVLWNAGMAAASIGQGVFAAATGAGTASLAGNTIALGAHKIATVAGTIATKAAAAGMRIFNAVLRMNPIGLIITAITALVAGLVWFFTQTETGRKVWETVWGAIKTVVSAVVDWIMNTAVPFLKQAWDAIATGATWLWENVLKPVWDNVKGVIENVVDWIMNTAVPWIQQSWRNFTVGLGLIIDRAKEVWDGIKEKFTNIVDFVKGLPDQIKSAASGMWDGIKDAFKGVINWVIRAWNSLSFTVPSVEVFGKKIGGMTLAVPKLQEFAAGGWTGPGGKYKPAGIVHADEFVLTKAARASIEGKYPGLLDFMNRTGTLPMPGAMPGYAEGGHVSSKQLVDFAKGVEGQPYKWGGVNWGDCSGAVSAIANFAVGMSPFASRFATGSEKGELAKRGFKPGLGPAGSLNIGWFNGGPYGGHTAATLPDGTNFEMGGGRGNGQFGGQAAGANDSQFTDHAHLPPEFFCGLDAGAPTTGGGSAPAISTGSGSGGGGGSTSSSSSSSSSSSPSKSTGGSGSGAKSKQEQAAGDLGKIFAGGILETIGFDGSVFANPMEWDGVKFFASFFGKGGSGGFGTLANVFNPTQETSTVTGQNALTANGDGGGALASAATNIATTALDAKPTTVDNSINLHGNVGMDPQAVQTSIEKKRTERTRTYSTSGVGL